MNRKVNLTSSEIERREDIGFDIKYRYITLTRHPSYITYCIFHGSAYYHYYINFSRKSFYSPSTDVLLERY